MSLHVLLGLVGLLITLLIGGLLGRLWKRHEERAIDKKWQERERLLDRRQGPAPRSLRRRSRRRRRRTHAGRTSAPLSGRGRRSGRR